MQFDLQLPVRFRWARNPIFAISAAWAAVYSFSASGPGYTPFNELYFLSAGKFHLDWSYADQPIGLPLLARLADTIWADSTLGLRIPAIIMCVVGIIVASLLAREFGGGARAQIATAAMYGALGVVPGWSEMETTSFDPQLWLVIIYFLARWMRTESARYLIGAGLVTGLALSVKYLVPVLWVGIVIGVLLCGPRRILTRPALWLGGCVAIVVALPGLLWQQAHDWPQAAMTEHLSSRDGLFDFGTGRFLVLVPFGAFALIGGIIAMFRIRELRPFRFLAVALAVALAAVFASGGRGDYVNGLIVAVIVCGIAAADMVLPARLLRWGAGPLAAVTVIIPLVLVGASTVEQEIDYAGNIVAQITSVTDKYPETPIVSDTYEMAAKVEYLGSTGRENDSPGRVFSPNLGYWYFGPPPNTDSVLYITRHENLPEPLERAFRTITQVSTTDADNLGPAYVWNLSGRTEMWDTLWPQLSELK
ncbi:MAG: glycosyltransferase family 39 protein [Rhodococcus sp. (in: high G+C Gram-positive bacteria)]